MNYKVHLACDGEAEMPLAFRAAPVNEHDSKRFILFMEGIKVKRVVGRSRADLKRFTRIRLTTRHAYDTHILESFEMSS